MNVKGLTILEILDIDLDAFNKLNESELRAITSRLVSAGNKRIRRLEKHNINAPALQGLGKEKRFTTKLQKGTPKQQRVNKLRAEFSRARSFLTSETSTIKGYKNFQERTYERIHKETNIPKDFLRKHGNKLFDLLHKAQQKGIVSSYRGSKGSMQARNTIAEILMDNPDVNEDTLMEWLEEQSIEDYEDNEKPNDETEETTI